MSFWYSVLLSIYMEKQILPFESDPSDIFFSQQNTRKSQNPQLSIFISQNDMLSAIEMSHFCSSWSNHRASTFEGPAVPLQLSGAWLAPSLHVGAEVSLKIKAFFEMPSFLQADVVYCTYIYIYMYGVIDLSVHLFTYVYLFIWFIHILTQCRDGAEHNGPKQKTNEQYILYISCRHRYIYICIYRCPETGLILYVYTYIHTYTGIFEAMHK